MKMKTAFDYFQNELKKIGVEIKKISSKEEIYQVKIDKWNLEKEMEADAAFIALMAGLVKYYKDKLVAELVDGASMLSKIPYKELKRNIDLRKAIHTQIENTKMMINW